MTIALWILQVLLAALFIVAGGMKLVMPIEQMKGPVEFPGWFLRFIGVAALLGGIGLIVPALARVRPGLTPLAAAGLVIIMLGASAIGLMVGDFVMALLPFVIGLLAAFVAYGRWRVAPVAARRHA